MDIGLLLLIIIITITSFVYCKLKRRYIGLDTYNKLVRLDLYWGLFILLIIVVISYLYKNHTKEQFYLEKQGLPSEEVTIDNRIYMCKDKDDTPASCNTYGIGDPILNKYINSSAPCPKNWLEPGNSIYN
jgi:hypothetical protein